MSDDHDARMAATIWRQDAEITRLREMVEAADGLAKTLVEARKHIAGSAPDWHYRTQEELSAIDAALATYQHKREGGE